MFGSWEPLSPAQNYENFNERKRDSDNPLFSHVLSCWMVNAYLRTRILAEDQASIWVSHRHTEIINGKQDSDSRYYSVLSFLPVVEIRMSFSLAEGCRAFV